MKHPCSEPILQSQSGIAELRDEVERLRAQLETERAHRDVALAAKTEESIELRAALLSETTKTAELGSALAMAAARASALTSELYAMKLSTSWRLTRPARSVSEKLPWVVRQLRWLRRMALQAVRLWLGPRVRRQLQARRDLQLIAESNIVDRGWYLEQNPDLLRSGMDPALHYLQLGAAAGRNPNPLFDNEHYLGRYPDVRQAGMNPAIHYLRHGIREGRDPFPPFGSLRPPAGNRAAVRIETPMAPASSPDSLAPALLRVFRTLYPSDDVQPVRALYGVLARNGGCVASPAYFRDAPYLQVLRADVSRLARSRYSGAKLDASIVVPAYNNLVHTLCCISAVLSWPTRATFEIIVADDASTDATAEVMSSIGGVVRHHRNPANVGFLRNCNAGAERARGDVLVILNNDTVPLPGWLDELVDTLRLDPSVGLVGSKLLNSDGTLQEAGGIVWRDGSASNFGRGGDATSPPFNYCKDVDYASAASIAIRKADWLRLQGFDEIYSPAYCEDSDLAFRMRRLGLRTVYQPLSAVVHHEGVSHGRDLSKGIKAYQTRNSRVFFDRWKETLARENFPPGTDTVLARDRSRGRPRILFIDHYTPQPDRDAGSRTVYDYLTLFKAAGFHVMFWPQNMHFDRPYTTELQRRGIEVMYDTDTRTHFSEWLRSQAGPLQYVFISRPTIAADFIEEIRRETATKILFYGHDIHFRRLAKELEFSADPSIEAEMRSIEGIERDVWSRCDAIYYPSEEECDIVRAEHPGRSVQVIPPFQCENARLDATRERLRASGIPRSGRLLFVGGFRHRPNVDGILWFVHEVWPRIVASIPGCRLWIAGSSPPAEIMELAGPGIAVTGFLPDEALRELYEAAQVAIVPLRFGGGVKGKVIEALSYGTPLVATSTGMQGLSKLAEALGVCDTPEAFAGTVIDILRDPAAHIGRALAGVRFVEIAASAAAARAALALDVPELRRSDAKLDRPMDP
jgi:GT2 family glycosyltransferase